jgi:NAD(P)-dependent dehydrogenase (short-subunit alcohol dehydrogenase family)
MKIHLPTDPPPPPLDADALRDRVVLVTGAGRGLGHAVALAAARAGATVVLHGRDDARLEAAYDAVVATGAPEPAALPLDFETATERAFDEAAGAIERACGRLDAVVHCAIHLEKLAPTPSMRLDAWQRLHRVNFVAPLRLTAACQRLLLASPDPCVLVTLHEKTFDPGPFWSPIAAMHAALHAALVSWAAEQPNSGPRLRIEAIVPGPVATPARVFTHPGAGVEAIATSDAVAARYLGAIQRFTHDDRR